MNEVVVGIVALFALLCIFATGIPLAFAMTLVGFGGFVLLNDFGIALGLLSNDFFDSLANYGLTAVPLFVLMGQIALNSSIAKGLHNAAHKFLGHIPGGLATATVVGATVFKSICGSMIATSATFASIAIPEMDRYHYKKELSTGIVASVGTLGNLLPERNTDIVGPHDGAVDWQAFYGRHIPRTYTGVILCVRHFRLVQIEPLDRA